MSDDLTEHKKVEEALQESNERFSKAFNSSPNPMLIAQLPDGMAVDVNDRFLQLFELSRAEVVGHKSTDYQNIIPPTAQRQRIIQDLIEKGIASNYEIQAKTKSGKRLILIFSAVTANFNGKPNAIAVFTDITERQKVEEALRKSEDRFRSVIESSLDVIYRYNLQTGHYEYMSPAIRNLGFEPEEMVAMSNEEVLSRVYPEDLPTLKRVLSNLIKTGCGYSEYRFKGKDDVYRWWSNQMILVKDENGQPLYRDGDVRDISESKQVAEVLKQRTEQLELTQKKLEENAIKLEEYASQMETLAEQRARQLQESERLAAIGQTAGMVGHDIRNPLQAMMSDVYLLKELLKPMPQMETRDEVVESLDGLERNIAYVNKIVADLQDFARPLKPEYSLVSVLDVVNSVLKNVALPENIKLELDINAPRQLKTEATFVTRSLTNLMTNAIQAMPTGGTLTLTAEETMTELIITVKDTGVGIPDDVKPRIFSPMTTTKSKGQGLGLAVVKRLIEALNGNVSFESREGKGTLFKIELPLMPPKS